MARYSGLSEKTILQHNLDVPTDFFWKDLLRERGGFTVGRLDSRYKGIDRKEAGERPDYNSELTSWLHSFTPAINHYLRTELKYETDIKYNMFGPVSPWDNSNDTHVYFFFRKRIQNSCLVFLAFEFYKIELSFSNRIYS
jgi:hypothetical protein